MMDYHDSGAAPQTAPPALPPLAGFNAAWVKAAATCASRLRGKSSFLVLIFHRVLPRWDPLLPDEPDATSFAAQLDLIAQVFNVLPLSEAVARSASGSVPPRTACITFDDGYANNLEVAAPLLAARHMPATVFVATSFLDGGCMWNDRVIEAVRHAPAEFDLGAFGLPRFTFTTDADRRAAIAAILDGLKYLDPVERASRAGAIADAAGLASSYAPMLTEEGVRTLARFGIEVGAHTRTHPILTSISDEAAREEIAGSKRTLEDITSGGITGFAYPNGRPGRDYQRRHVELVREAGFGFAVSTAWGCASAAADRFQLPRAAAWDKTPMRYAARLVRTFLETRVASV